ncbi:MAG: AAA family ATPase [Clostridia bacterium]|nr:AAA family ATPase [Clostridia bacterium]
MKKIYIIGPVGSGKTTLARALSKKFDIEMHELDKIVWDDDNYKPTFKGLIQMLGWAKQDLRAKDQKLDFIKSNAKKYEILKKKDIKKQV